MVGDVFKVSSGNVLPCRCKRVFREKDTDWAFWEDLVESSQNTSGEITRQNSATSSSSSSKFRSMKHNESTRNRDKRMAVNLFGTEEAQIIDSFYEAGELYEHEDIQNDLPKMSFFVVLESPAVNQVKDFLKFEERSWSKKKNTVFFQWIFRILFRKFHAVFAIFLTISLIAVILYQWWLYNQDLVTKNSFYFSFSRLRFEMALLPLRLSYCFSPMIPFLLYNITDIWGNARIQTLVELYAGENARGGQDQSLERKLSRGDSNDEIGAKNNSATGGNYISNDSGSRSRNIKRGGSFSFAQNILGGFMRNSNDNSRNNDGKKLERVPWRTQFNELMEIVKSGLEGSTNLLHTLNSTTVLSFSDKEGLLTDTCIIFSLLIDNRLIIDNN